MLEILFFQNIRKELVDGRVLEAHIVPHKLLFTSMSPTLEFPSVAWLPEGIQVHYPDLSDEKKLPT